MTVQVWRGSDARWHWRYVEPSADGSSLTLYGNKHYASRDEAARAATTAYPDVPLLERTPASTGSRRSRRRVVVAMVLVMLLVVAWRRDRRRRPARSAQRRSGST
jgi:hypothetical protein